MKIRIKLIAILFAGTITGCQQKIICGTYSDSYRYLKLNRDSSFIYKKRRGHGIDEFARGIWNANGKNLYLKSFLQDTLSVVEKEPLLTDTNFIELRSPYLDNRFYSFILVNDSLIRTDSLISHRFTTKGNITKIAVITILRNEFKPYYSTIITKDTFKSKPLIFADKFNGGHIVIINNCPNEFIFWKNFDYEFSIRRKELKNKNIRLYKIKGTPGFLNE